MARMNARPSSRYDSALPAPGDTSDQENTDPMSTRGHKGKGRASDLPPPSPRSLSTPTSHSGDETRGQKRKRPVPQQRADPASEDAELDDLERDIKKFTRYFDPYQDPEQRRETKRESRALEREFNENRDDLLRDSGRGLTRTIRKANKIYQNVKQTNDATLDSRLLVNVSDLAYKKTAQLVVGDNSIGVDVDDFLSKCITYMRSGGPLEHDQENAAAPRRTQRQDDSDNEGDDDDDSRPLDWEVLGRNACFPFNARPCLPSFLLGPLSVEKKQRTQTQRRARQTKDNAGREVRPETLSREDLSNSDESGLKAVCQRINRHLLNHVNRGVEAFNASGVQSFTSERGKALLKQTRMTETGGPSLFDYVLNPHSFGQTVENLFYVSFLIKEGAVGIQNDSQGLPTLMPSEASSVEELRKNKTSKHQAVFSIDYGTWQQLVEAFDISEPLIEHRPDNAEARAQRMGERGWYT